MVTYLLTVVLALMIVVGIVLYYQYRIKKKANSLLALHIKLIHSQNAELQKNNDKLAASETNLQESNRTKDRFFSIISHDLKGPLNSLTGLLQILVKYVDSFSKEELKEFAGNMDKSVRNLLDLLNNLLQWSKAQSGNIEYRPKKADLQKVVTETIDVLSGLASNKGIELKAHIPVGLLIYADVDMLSFTLRNLIFNAIKFTHKGGKVQVEATNKSEMMEIAVIDNGIGISNHDMAKLFKIDTYHTTNGTANEMGTGLGLILCREFVEKNGGKIFVESEVNKGTTFKFTVPISKK